MIPQIIPKWPAPSNIHACSTTRLGGISLAPYHTFNLSDHVGDTPEAIRFNRQRLKQTLQLKNEPLWLEQVHGTTVIDAHSPKTLQADGAYTHQPHLPCVILTADCLPILLCNSTGTEIAALHGGWRSLFKGIIQKGLQKFSSPPTDLFAWLGPAISAQCYEVDETVYQSFQKDTPFSLAEIFMPSKHGHFLFNLYQYAKEQLKYFGIQKIYEGSHQEKSFCTYTDAYRFYSYRRDGQTGRLAHLIWIDPS